MENKNAQQNEAGEIQVIKIAFRDIENPVFEVHARTGAMRYGKNNAYDQYLLDLYNGSAKHGGIVRGKAKYIAGSGLLAADGTKVEDLRLMKIANSNGESFREVLSKAILDVGIYSAAYLEILGDARGNISEIYHRPFRKMRPDEDEKTFYYRPAWARKYTGKKGDVWEEISTGDPVAIPAYNRNKGQKRSILYIKEYSPAGDVFPLPEYAQCIKYIQIDIGVADYHLSAINKGMFASKMIHFSNGVPKDGNKKEIEKGFNDKFTGSHNAGTVIVTFSKQDGTPPAVIDLSATDLDKHFDLLAKSTEQQILTGHEVTSGMLFGLKTEGQLGGRNELREAAELFQNTYVNNKQIFWEKYINLLGEKLKWPTLNIQRIEPISFEFSETTLASVTTDDEIRESMGRKPLTPEQKAELAARKGSAAAPPATQGAPAKFGSQEPSEEDILNAFAQAGVDRGVYEITSTREGMVEAEAFATVKQLTELDLKVLAMIRQDKRVTPDAIAEALEIKTGKVQGILKRLVEAEYITEAVVDNLGSKEVHHTVTDAGSDAIKNGGGGTLTSTKIMYSYEWRPEIPVSERDSAAHPSRSFCRKMMDLNRLYSRADIEDISRRLEYSVWDRRGGWWNKKPACRHIWQSNVVTEKS